MHPHLDELRKIFQTTADKYEAHRRSASVLEAAGKDPTFLAAILDSYLSDPDNLNKGNFPVVGIKVESNPYFDLMAHCWIPLPDGDTDRSTKAIHHHGVLLLSTVNAFGPGYEHWTFTTPEPIDPERGLYGMELRSKAVHQLHNVDFVDAFVPHLPMFPPGVTITYALWSSKFPVTWKDRLKRVPLLKRNEAVLKRALAKLGLAKTLAIKVVENFDFYPVDEGFQVMPEREEFGLGPNEDHLRSVFNVLQATGNAQLGNTIRRHLARSPEWFKNRTLIEDLLSDLHSGNPIEGRLSENHLNIPHAWYTSADVEQAITASGAAANGRGAASYARS